MPVVLASSVELVPPLARRKCSGWTRSKVGSRPWLGGNPASVGRIESR